MKVKDCKKEIEILDRVIYNSDRLSAYFDGTACFGNKKENIQQLKNKIEDDVSCNMSLIALFKTVEELAKWKKNYLLRAIENAEVDVE